MSKGDTMNTAIKNSIVSSVIAFVVTGILSIIGAYIVLILSVPDFSVKIDENIKMNDGKYFTQITVTNNNAKVKGPLFLQFPVKIIEKSIVSNIPINLFIPDSKTISSIGSNIQIKDVLGKQTFVLLILSDQAYDVKKVNASSSNSDVSISYLQDDKLRNKALLGNIIIFSIIFGIFNGLFNYYYEMRITKKIQDHKDKSEKLVAEMQLNMEEVNKLCDKQNHEASRLKEELSQTKLDINTMKIDLKKETLLLRSRIREYNKELDFWRNTIRKMLYNSKVEQLTSDEIIKLVTKELGTYQTNCSDNVCLESVKAMSVLIEEKAI